MNNAHWNEDAREDFALVLKEALCSEQEIKAWQMGEPFSDPWLIYYEKFNR